MKTKAYYRSKGATTKLVALKGRLKFIQTYKPSEKMPETEAEIYSWLYNIVNDLSPENLTCDGEVSVAQARKKQRMLMREWKDLEKLLGKKVSETEVINKMMGE